MAQRQFRSDDTSLWIDKFGYGSDGDYAPSTGDDAPIDSACTGTINTTSLSATNASFAIGQLILIHQTQGTGAGQWELNKIANYSAGTITTAYPLIFGYVTGAQVLVMSQHSSGNIATGQTISAKLWNGTVGGIYAKFFNGTFTYEGTLLLNGKGFRGGLGSTGAGGNPAQAGESEIGGVVKQSANNGSGGGGGNDTTPAGTGGTTNGSTNLVTILFGGGGGGNGNSGGGAAPGGGIGFIFAKNIIQSGSGSSDVGGGITAAGGGGGGGGSLLMKCETATLGTNKITSIGGTGGNSGTGAGGGGGGAATSGSNGSTGAPGTAGSGGNGRIHIDYALSLSGSTSPALDSTQDISLLSSGTMTTNTKKW